MCVPGNPAEVKPRPGQALGLGRRLFATLKDCIPCGY